MNNKDAKENKREGNIMDPIKILAALVALLILSIGAGKYSDHKTKMERIKMLRESLVCERATR